MTSYTALVAVEQLDTVETKNLFRAQPAAGGSPLDRFLTSTNRLNLIYLRFGQDGIERMPELASMIVLGYMSAVESYVRAVVTGLINLDDACRRQVRGKNISFALAMEGHSRDLLPEALMEHMTFTTDGKIAVALRDLLGLTKFSNDVDAALREFAKLCQVRHCCVHRFGKLGSSNALDLGFDSHRKLIELPFAPTLEEVERIADVLLVLVKTLNNFLFREILERTVPDSLEGRLSWTWRWTWSADRRKFQKYYDLFASTIVAPVSAPARSVYATFQQEHAARVAAHALRTSRASPR